MIIDNQSNRIPTGRQCKGTNPGPMNMEHMKL